MLFSKTNYDGDRWPKKNQSSDELKRSMDAVKLMKWLSFRETTRFTKKIVELLDDESYAQFQLFLAEFPDAGDFIKGGGSVRFWIGP